MIRQRWISLLPRFTAELVRSGDTGSLRLTNIGSGTATHVVADDILVTSGTGVTIRIAFTPSLYILPVPHSSARFTELNSHIRNLEGGTEIQREVARKFVGANSWQFSPPSFPDVFTITVRFDDIYDSSYMQTITLKRSEREHFIATELGRAQRL
jgi:hypothetical protein